MTDVHSASPAMHPSRRFSLSRLLGRKTTRRAARQEAHRNNFEALEDRTLFAVSVDAEGFTVVSPSGDSKVVYVSSSGSDSNSGLSEGDPVKSIARGRSLLRDGMPDQLLLKRGDVFFDTFGSWTRSGRSASEPMLIGTYGSGARPVVNTGTASGLTGGRDAINHLVIQGIHLNAHTRDPDSFVSTSGGAYGIQILSPLNNLVIEDMYIEHYRFNLSIQQYYGPMSDVTLRRNVVSEAYSNPGGGHSQGIYAYGIDGFTMVENVFDHNGWLSDRGVPSATATMFNHGAYIKENLTNVLITGNIFSNNSAHGLQARAGGNVHGNLFVNNPVHMSYGLVNGSPTTPGGVSGEISGNVFLGGRDINGSARGWAVEIGNTNPNKQTVLRDNVFAHDNQGHFPAISLNYGNDISNPGDAAGLQNVTVQDNVVYNWFQHLGLSSGFQNAAGGLRGFNNLNVTGNQFQLSGSSRVVVHGNSYNGAIENWNGNKYYTNKSASGWFSISGATTSYDSWKSQVDGAADNTPIFYDDPDRNPGTYNALMGGTGTVSAYMEEAKRQGKGSWRVQYTTDQIVGYIREGFGLSGSSVPNPGPPGGGGGGIPPTVIPPRVRMFGFDMGPGDSEQILTVTYKAASGVSLDSVGDGDIQVGGPNSYDAAAIFLSKAVASDGTVVAKYRVPPPGSSWNAADDGTYTVSLNANQVNQGDGTAFVAQTVGTFRVDFAQTIVQPPGGVPPAGGVFAPGTAPGAPTPVAPPPPGFDNNPAPPSGQTPPPIPPPPPGGTPGPGTNPNPTPTPTPGPTPTDPTVPQPGSVTFPPGTTAPGGILPPGVSFPPGTVFPPGVTPPAPGAAFPPGIIPPGGVFPPGTIFPPGTVFPPETVFPPGSPTPIPGTPTTGVTFPPGTTAPGGTLPPGVSFPSGTVFPPGIGTIPPGGTFPPGVVPPGGVFPIGTTWPPGTVFPPGTWFPPGTIPPDGTGVVPPITTNVPGGGGTGTGGGGTVGTPPIIGPLPPSTGGGTGGGGVSAPPIVDVRAPIIRRTLVVQRVRADRIEISFTEDVGSTITVDDLIVKNVTTQVALPSSVLSLSYDARTLTATITFPGIGEGELPAGDYMVTLLGGGISDAAGNVFDGNADGTAGGDFQLEFTRG